MTDAKSDEKKLPETMDDLDTAMSSASALFQKIGAEFVDGLPGGGLISPEDLFDRLLVLLITSEMLQTYSLDKMTEHCGVPRAKSERIVQILRDRYAEVKRAKSASSGSNGGDRVPGSAPSPTLFTRSRKTDQSLN